MSSPTEKKNLFVFRDCLAELVLSQLDKATITSKPASKRKQRKKLATAATPPTPPEIGGNELVDGGTDFVDVGNHPRQEANKPPPSHLPPVITDKGQYLAEEIFHNLPISLQVLEPVDPATPNEQVAELPSTWEDMESLSHHIPGSVSDSLVTYGLVDVPATLSTVLPIYLETVTALPPPINWKKTRTEACELCERDWIPLTYHHLIPRSTHAMAVKRGLHEERELNRVAWLCAACHRFVHRAETNEELARNWDTVEKLREREDVKRFVRWVSTVRWKKR